MIEAKNPIPLPPTNGRTSELGSKQMIADEYDDQSEPAPYAERAALTCFVALCVIFVVAVTIAVVRFYMT